MKIILNLENSKSKETFKNPNGKKKDVTLTKSFVHTCSKNCWKQSGGNLYQKNIETQSGIPKSVSDR